jgi:tetratricopeptide (TPR) repeat protein
MVYLANCYRHFREWNTVSYWKLAAFEKSKHPEVILSIAQDYEQMGEWKQAIEWYQRLLKNPSFRTAGYQGVSWNLLKLNRLSEASLWVKKGLTLAPQDPELLFTYIWIQLNEGNVKQAEKALEILPEEMKEHPAWIMLHSRFFTQTEQYAQANALISKLIDQEKPMIQALGYYQKGRILLEKGDIPQALQYFQTSRRRFPEWKDPLFYEGICHLLHGRLNETKQCWQQLS